MELLNNPSPAVLCLGVVLLLMLVAAGIRIAVQSHRLKLLRKLHAETELQNQGANDRESKLKEHIFRLLFSNKAKVALTSWKSTLLIVEQDGTVRENLESMLKETFPDLTIRSTSDGMDALALYATTPFSMVILDLEAPVLDGYQIIKILHGRDYAPQFLVVSSVVKSRSLLVKNLGEDTENIELLMRPYQESDLVAHLEEMIKRQHPLKVA